MFEMRRMVVWLFVLFCFVLLVGGGVGDSDRIGLD